MEESLDYEAIIAQLQFENETLRLHAKMYNDIHDALWSPIADLQEIWRKISANRTQFLIGLMLVYWVLSIAFLIWEHLK